MASLTWCTHVWINSKIGDRQGCLVCCSPWGHKESDTKATELNWKGLWRSRFFYPIPLIMNIAECKKGKKEQDTGPVNHESESVLTTRWKVSCIGPCRERTEMMEVGTELGRGVWKWKSQVTILIQSFSTTAWTWILLKRWKKSLLGFSMQHLGKARCLHLVDHHSSERQAWTESWTFT